MVPFEDVVGVAHECMKLVYKSEYRSDISPSDFQADKGLSIKHVFHLCATARTFFERYHIFPPVEKQHISENATSEPLRCCLSECKELLAKLDTK